MRALGHELQPVVHIGRTGLSPGVRQQLEQALCAHELIKVRLLRECPLDRAEVAAELSSCTGSAHIQSLGGVILLYRARPDKPRIILPDKGFARRSTPTGSKRKEPARAAPARNQTSRQPSPGGRKTNRQSNKRASR